VSAPSLPWLAALAAEVLDQPTADALAAADVDRLRRVIDVTANHAGDPIDEAGCLLWAIGTLRPLTRRNGRLAVLAADLHLTEHGMTLATGNGKHVRKLLDGMATAHVEQQEVIAWVREHTDMPEMAERKGRMFERFTDRARQSLALAHEEAAALGHNFIGTEHLLLGMLSEGTGVGAVILNEMGMTLDGTRAKTAELIGPVSEHTEPLAGQYPFTPRAKKVLELSLREAISLHHNYIGTEHMLLGLIREGDGVGAQLIKLACDRPDALEMLRRKVTDTIGVAATIKCSFCGKTQKQVRKLIRGSSASICDECVEMCNQIIIEELGDSLPDHPRESAPESTPQAPRCPSCRRSPLSAAVHVLKVGDDDIRLLACASCGAVVTTLS
jgi:hypothetical protein